MKHSKKKLPVSFLSGTYTEFIGNRTQPRSVYERPILFLLGPSGSGKTTVAQHYLGTETSIVRSHEVSILLLDRVLNRSWEGIYLLKEPKLILELPAFIVSRPHIKILLIELLKLRIAKGYRTAVLDSEDNTSLQGVLASIDLDQRMCIVLRFPSGRGRYRFLAHRCRSRSIPLRYARKLSKLEPWSYKIALGELELIEESLKKNQALS